MSLYARKPRTPTLATALLIKAIGTDYTLEPYHPVPIPGPDEVLIRCVAVSLNPVDWQSKAYNFGISSLPWVNGRDASGVIEAVGDNMSSLCVGDAVFTLTDYTKSHSGSYQEFFIATASSVARIPSGMSFESAAALPVAAITAAISLQRYMGIGPSVPCPISAREHRCLLIWGGATSTGYMAIQLAKIYGLSVITVASTVNFEYLRQAGADVVLDRKDPDEALRRIREITHGRLRLAFDAVGPTTARLCARALCKEAGQPSSVLVALAGLPKDVVEGPVFSTIMLPTVKVKLFHNEPTFGRHLLQELTAYLGDGRLKPPRISILSGGFQAVETGLLKLRNKEISGRKLVIRVDETNNLKESRHDLGWL
ncbi:oxidoreductase [Aspergillus pseudodeflectus]|uniref:Oxidoreductase n=1 Tax=Aspergillus pseudodeflectus TaxID=176178 RepID=A0ABR4K3W3_9EURO